MAFYSPDKQSEIMSSKKTHQSESPMPTPTSMNKYFNKNSSPKMLYENNSNNNSLNMPQHYNRQNKSTQALTAEKNLNSNRDSPARFENLNLDDRNNPFNNIQYKYDINQNIKNSRFTNRPDNKSYGAGMINNF